MPPLPKKNVTYRDVPGFEGYRVGDDGTVWTRWEPNPGRSSDGHKMGGARLGTTWKLMKPERAGGNKSLRVRLRKGGRSVSKFVHTLVLETFVGPRPEGMVSRHGPGGKYDNRASNLCWGTQKQNIADKYRDGTRVYGTRHHYAKMTPDKVREARRLYKFGASALSLSKRYGIAYSTMTSILKGLTWKEVV